MEHPDGSRIARFEIASSYAGVARRHLPWAIVTGSVLLVSAWIPYDTLEWRLCGFLRLTGYSCMFCGFSRAFGALTAGDFRYAMTYAPASILLYALTGIAFLWNATGLVLARRVVPGRWMRAVRPRWWISALAAVILLNWIYRLSMGYR